MFSKTLSQIGDLALEGLQTDGEHHKQWYLEEILKKICSPGVFEEVVDEGTFERGIAP